ncbi:MAG: SusE domain-containing protein [Saprospiraceae bacterium]
MRKQYFLLSLLALMMWGCSEDEFGPVLSLGDKPGLTSPTANASYVITEAIVDDVMATFTWTAADFGYEAGIDYDVQIDKAGNNFAAPVSLGPILKGGLSMAVTNGKVNTILLAKDLPAGVSSPVEVRVVASVSSEVDKLISPTLSINVTPFLQAIDYPKLNVPGSYQGWNPGDLNTVVYSVRSDDKYEGYLYMNESSPQFKYARGSWDTNWGDTGADGTLEPGGDNIAPGAGGMYRLNVDLNALTHTYAKTDWGLIGSSTPTGWDSDTDMVYDAVSGTLKLTLNLVGGFIKFRANDAWDINLGDDGGNRIMEYGGADIPIAEAGNYTIELILNQANYSYTITKN